ncbi:hypothetical protein SAMN02927914_04766 [Mesorhizobium qingshengii]|uniref:Uncharacterized protein n=1 Tax=Mesorhizobium qingshengii TaxID=1165689 RepID=A0A1G5ZCC0_9HYPH|nr:hypothetical protein SAMN02927914_04766 [Mesorhizobium qingshengii]
MNLRQKAQCVDNKINGLVWSAGLSDSDRSPAIFPERGRPAVFAHVTADRFAGLCRQPGSVLRHCHGLTFSSGGRASLGGNGRRQIHAARWLAGHNHWCAARRQRTQRTILVHGYSGEHPHWSGHNRRQKRPKRAVGGSFVGTKKKCDFLRRMDRGKSAFYRRQRISSRRSGVRRAFLWMFIRTLRWMLKPGNSSLLGPVRMDNLPKAHI